MNATANCRPYCITFVDTFFSPFWRISAVEYLWRFVCWEYKQKKKKINSTVFRVKNEVHVERGRHFLRCTWYRNEMFCFSTNTFDRRMTSMQCAKQTMSRILDLIIIHISVIMSTSTGYSVHAESLWKLIIIYVNLWCGKIALPVGCAYC